MDELPNPITRSEQYLAKIAGAEPTLPTPITREERYLAKIAGEDVDIPPAPITRTEQYLAAIAENGGGGVEVEALTATQNKTYTAPEGKAYSPVTVNVPNSYAAGDEGKVVSGGALVSQSSDTVTQNGTVDTTLINSLTVNVPNSYAAGDEGKVVSSGALVAQTSKNITSSGTIDTTLNNSVVVPAGSATTPATTITPNTLSISVNSSTGVITASNTAKTQSVTPTVSGGYVSSGTAGTITVSAASKTENLSVQAAQTITPTTSDQTIAAGKYLTGAQTIKGDANLIASNIKDGVSIFGVSGTYQGGVNGWTKLYEWEETLTTTSTSVTTLLTKTIDIPRDPNAYYVLSVRDKAGIRNGYFYGADTFAFMYGWQTTSDLSAASMIYYTKSSGNNYLTAAGGAGTTRYGIFSNGMSQTSLTISGRYDASKTQTINGTFTIRLYKLDFSLLSS